MVVWAEGFSVNKNALLAKTLFTNQLATREQIARYWDKATDEHNLAELLRDAGVLSSEVCAQVLDFVSRMGTPAQPPAPATIEEDEVQVQRQASGGESVVMPKQEPTRVSGPGSSEPDADVGLGSLTTGVSLLPESAESVNLALESNSFAGAMLGAGQVVPALDGLQSNRVDASLDFNKSGVLSPQELDSLPIRYTVVSGEEGNIEAPRSISPDSSLAQLVAFACQKRASDIYLQAGMPILLRCGGRMLMGCEQSPSLGDVERWLGESASGRPDGRAPEKDVGCCEAIGLPGLGRVRLTTEWSAGQPLLSLRLFSPSPLGLHELGLPEFCQEWTFGNGGLVLVSGGAGSGRSTTMRSFILQAMADRPLHAQTLERPIGVLLKPSSGLLLQKEVGLHVPDACMGIRAVLDDGPDLFAFDGLRTGEELQSLMRLANSGVLVVATTEGNHALAMLQGLYDAVPSGHRDTLRAQLAELLRGVVCQHLLPRKNEASLALAVEAFKVTPSIASLIRKNDLQQLPAAIVGLKHYGQTLDDNLASLLETGAIEGVDAWSHAVEPRRFQQHRPQVRKK